MAYLLDANVFIQAKNLHYGLDFCPAFWDWLVQENGTGKVLSVSQVADELLAGDDELANWAQARGESLFRETDPETLPAFTEVSTWVQSQNFEPAAVNTFLQVADYFLLAFAKAHGHTIVTHEVPSDSRRKIKIPTVGIAIGVPSMTPYAMLRRERVRFVLGPNRRGSA